ncbi:MAG: hypothetical protein ICV77_05460 [Cyanobacteria bacterium Co-bin8]|nr:hypothetical protein [Cyanobacteria bacterium Co-bin8]
MSECDRILPVLLVLIIVSFGKHKAIQGSFNEQYTFVGTREQINSQLEAGRQLYDREQPANS